MRRILLSLGDVHSHTLDCITSLYVRFESETQTSQRKVMSVTPESVIKLPVPSVEVDTKTGRPSAGTWPIIKLQTLIDLVTTPRRDEHATKDIRRNVVVWEQYVPSAGVAVFLINRKHVTYYQDFYSDTSNCDSQ